MRTDVAAFVGIAERGPVGSPTWVTSWQQFTSVFGGFVRAGFLAYSVKAFFDNGGELCVVVRVAAQTASAATVGAPASRDSAVLASSAGFAIGAVVSISQHVTVSSAGAQLDARTESLVDDVRPFARGAVVELTQLAATVLSTVAATDPAAGVVVWTEPLSQELDLTQPFTLSTVVTAEALVATVDEMTATVTWTSPLDDRFRIGVAAAQLHLATGAARAEAALVLDQAAPTLVLEAQSPGRWGDALEVVVARDAEDSFSLAVFEAGELRELVARLSATPGAERDATVFVAQESRLVRVVAAAPLPDDLAARRLRFGGGRDGTAALRADDLTGAPDDLSPRGLGALQNVDGISIVAVPDALVPPTPARPAAILPPPVQPDPCRLEPPAPPDASPTAPLPLEAGPSFSETDVLAVQQALVAHCEERRDRIALLDVPMSASAARDRLVAWRNTFDSSYAALYHPWVSVVDPLPTDALVRAIPPSGHVAGVIARIDLAAGVHTPPANVELRWAQGLSADVDTATQTVLNPLGINCLRLVPGRGRRVYGERTLSSDPLLRYVNVRRLLAMIETALGRGTQWAVFESNDVYLRTLLRVSISGFLHDLWEQGAFAGASEDEAYFVLCDEATNPPDQVDRGILLALVGVAPVQPAEFVVLRIARVEGTLQVTDA